MEDTKLNFPTKPLTFVVEARDILIKAKFSGPITGKVSKVDKTIHLDAGMLTVEEYIIPDDQKMDVLAQYYPFELPKRGTLMCDIHTNKTFLIQESKLIWDEGANLVVSPFYEEGQGNALDFIEIDTI